MENTVKWLTLKQFQNLNFNKEWNVPVFATKTDGGVALMEAQYNGTNWEICFRFQDRLIPYNEIIAVSPLQYPKPFKECDRNEGE